MTRLAAIPRIALCGINGIGIASRWLKLDINLH